MTSDTKREETVRSTRTLVLAAFLALAASTPSAGATAVDPIEAESAVTGEMCPDTVTVGTHSASGGCQVHLVNVGPVDQVVHLAAGGEVSTLQCNVELTINIGPDAEGWVTNQEITSPTDARCGNQAAGGTQACNESGARDPWHINGYEADDGGIEGDLEVCLLTQLGTVTGDITKALEQDSVTGHVDGAETAGPEGEEARLREYTPPPPSGLSSIEFRGHFDVEGASVEIHHL